MSAGRSKNAGLRSVVEIGVFDISHRLLLGIKSVPNFGLIASNMAFSPGNFHSFGSIAALSCDAVLNGGVPSLGPAPIMEQAVAYFPGFGVKLWVALQDLGQLKWDYPDSRRP
jgi:hypothetical protein